MASFMALVLAPLDSSQAFSLFGKFKKVEPVDGQVRLALKDFDDGQARFYTYTHGKSRIRFFVLKSSDGIVRAAFDACDVCYRAGKGYRQDGGVMVCVNCGMRFDSRRINVVSGGCNPAPLERTVQGDHLVIEISDIEAGARFFPEGV
ncbi:MAG: DUF2318 domain-containing protein [Deltaproteobacteria bacterium]|nr:DUF2318 domain-containing protein [Deltaproteobacteria bacterium]